MSAATWMLLLVACFGGLALASPFGTVHKVVPVKTVSVTSETNPPPSVTVVKSHVLPSDEAREALGGSGSSLATAVGDIFTNLGTFLSELIRTGVNTRKVVVQHPVKKLVVHQPATATVEVEAPSPVTIHKKKTVLVN